MTDLPPPVPSAASTAQPVPSTPLSFLAALDHLRRSGHTRLCVLGGEPVQHPDFAWMLARAVEGQFSLTLLSMGLIPNSILRKLERLPVDQVTLLIEVAFPGESPPHEVARQARVLSRLGARVILRHNLSSSPVDLGYLLELIDRHALAPQVQLHLTRLTASDDALTDITSRITSFGRRARTLGIRAHLDGSWIAGVLGNHALEDIGIYPPATPECGPVFDLMPDGQLAFKTSRVQASERRWA